MSDSEAEKLFEERKKVARLSQIRELVFGAEDGLLVPLGVVSGVAAATTNNFYVLIAGLAEAFAGSISMGAGAYLSSKAEHEVQQWAISRERSEVETVPVIEKKEIEILFKSEGLSPTDASRVADLITTSKKSWIRTMVEKELGLSMDPDPSTARAFSTMVLIQDFFEVVIRSATLERRRVRALTLEEHLDFLLFSGTVSTSLLSFEIAHCWTSCSALDDKYARRPSIWIQQKLQRSLLSAHRSC